MGPCHYVKAIPRSIVVGVLLAAALFVTMAFTEEAASAQELVVGATSLVSSLDPREVRNQAEAFLRAQLYEPLFRVNSAFSLEPVLAESWEMQNDALVVKLRKDVKFHNGAEFTAEDVQYSSQRYAERQKLNIEAVEIIDQYTVRFSFKDKQGMMLLSTARVYVLCKKCTEAQGDEELKWRPPIGTGPYVYHNHVIGLSVRLTRASSHWRRRIAEANVDRIVLNSIPAVTTLVRSLQSNEVHMALGVGADDLPPAWLIPSPFGEVAVIPQKVYYSGDDPSMATVRIKQ